MVRMYFQTITMTVLLSITTGEATGSVPVKFGIGTDGRQIPISERIALALQIKREQQQQSESALKDKINTDGSANGQTDSARSTPAKSRPNGSSSKAAALERQQENYQKFKSSVSKQRREQQTEVHDSADGGATGGGYEEGGGAGEDAEEGGSEEPFLEYASPVAATERKSSSRGASRGKKLDDKKAAIQGAALGGQDEHPAEGTANDWIECLDPRSKRKYYYSAVLKKSTWTKPAGYSSSGSSRSTPGTPTLATMGVTMPSRYNSPNLSMHMAGRQPQQSGGAVAAQRMTADELAASSTRTGDDSRETLPLRSSSLRSASPFGATAPAASPSSAVQIDFAKVFSSAARNETTTAAQATGKASAYSSRSSSPAPSTSASSAKAALRSGSPSVRAAAQQSPARGAAEQDWVTAVDPNSNRKYWYNR